MSRFSGWVCSGWLVGLVISMAVAVPVSVRANEVLLESDGTSTGQFYCHYLPWTSPPVVSQWEGVPAPSVEFSTSSPANYSMAPYELPGIAVGQLLHGSLDVMYTGPTNSVEISGFGISVSDPCDYHPYGGPADGRYPMPSTLYDSGSSTLITLRRAADGTLERSALVYPLAIGSWHHVDFYFTRSQDGAFDYELWVDDLLVDSARSYEEVYSPDALGVVIGAVGSYRQTYVFYDNVRVELYPANCAPVADAGLDQELPANASCQALVLLDGSGSFDPDDDPLEHTWSCPAFGAAAGVTPTVTLPLGYHDVTLTVDDGRGATDTDSVFVAVEDRDAPTLVGLPDSVVAECSGPAGTLVALPQVTASDNCDPDPEVTDDRPVVYPLGTTLVTFFARDDAGNMSASELVVTVVDTTAPVVGTIGASPDALWPPNHAMRSVSVGVAATDGCDAAVAACSITSVTSNEPVDGPGCGNTSPDWVVTGDLTLELRAERCGGGSGREYTVEVTCLDASLNPAVVTTAVRVAHDMR